MSDRVSQNKPQGNGRPVQMNRVLRAVFLSTFALPSFALPSVAMDQPQALPLPHVAALRAARAPLRIVAFGSSSTEGVGASKPSASYPAQLQTVLTGLLPKSSRPEVINLGIGGEDIDDMIARLQTDVLAKKPDMVIWQIGSNDPMRAVPLDRFEDETRDGIAKIRAAGVDVMLMEPQWCPKLEGTPGANLFRDKVREIGVALDVPVIRRADLMHRWIDEGRLTQAEMIADDGLHMRDGGYALLARDVAAEILAGSNDGAKLSGAVAAALPAAR
jgi:acyl-CoA thioesterase-1